jgi:hypothetical protein
MPPRRNLYRSSWTPRSAPWVDHFALFHSNLPTPTPRAAAVRLAVSTVTINEVD